MVSSTAEMKEISVDSLIMFNDRVEGADYLHKLRAMVFKP